MHSFLVTLGAKLPGIKKGIKSGIEVWTCFLHVSSILQDLWVSETDEIILVTNWMKNLTTKLF